MERTMTELALRPGTYRIDARARDGRTASAEFTVGIGPGEPVVLRLDREARCFYRKTSTHESAGDQLSAVSDQLLVGVIRRGIPADNWRLTAYQLSYLPKRQDVFRRETEVFTVALALTHAV